ncbi:type II restriction endonuclease [Aphanothece hegewaldii CCALA 016]|uniref:site-specific DNA-methyltransferase (adenine-specific) n=1 Tax=Aphanothece hegewaldii CCALA 016 TaxID=2107694 RepID=A0A2T1LU46_9CHRO|nr:TaqI-like C-terminal specificity domain-containing protein [Aphanothece hegewaldii]PSF34956.1 type II restriction endonuclease [Aphanothece hegewaldii CCALA 016]
MPARLLQLDHLKTLRNPSEIANLFQRLGYNAEAQPLPIDDLALPTRSTEAIWDAHLIADQSKGTESLQVLLFHLREQEFASPSIASSRMRAIAKSLSSRASNYLLLGTKDYNQLMLVNPRVNRDNKDKFDNLKVSIRKLLIDRNNPTPYDRDRLEAIAVNGQSPNSLYKTHCEAFDVEKLTKKFYQGYKELFEKVQTIVLQHNPSSYFEDRERLHQFCQRLLGRVMFLYFLQKKEFLGGDRRFLKTQYERLRLDPEDTDFYHQILEPLFFDTLNRYRPNQESQWGQIPYLNGGLFDKDYGTDVIDAAGQITPERIIIPNALFDPGEPSSVLGFFNSYNFTVSENTPDDEDVAVDPEMLGKVFENLLAAEERGQSGTFYTPRGIVQFMCTEVLCRYLASETRMDLEQVSKIVDYDPELLDADFNQLMSSQQARKLKQALDTLKCLDPAVGSGAFPLGMMQVILNVKQAIARREGMTVQRGSLTISQWKRDIIANNLYGVDIKPEAIEIAKLRMWLSLVVDIPNIEDVEPLPNLDYKLMCGDSLISTIHGEQLIPDPTQEQQGMLAVTPIQQAIQPLLDLQHCYFNAQTEERRELRKQILEAEANVFRVAVRDRVSYWERKRKKLAIEIKTMGRASRIQQKELDTATTQLTQLERFATEVESGERSLNFFQYYLHFRDVFETKGGFDVVIGNPPYVRQEQIRELKPALQLEYECYTGMADLYVYFYEKGFNLLKSGGHLTYISSNKYFRSGYGEKLRKFLGDSATVQHLIDFGDAPVFEAIAYPSIILVSRSKPENHQARVLNWEEGQSIDTFSSVFKQSSFLILQKELTADGWRLESPSVLRLLDKLRASGTPLGEYVNGRFYFGILTGLNDAFLIDKQTYNYLIRQHSSSISVIKPLLRGRNIKRWSIEFAEQYLIRIESSENKKHSWSDKQEKEAENIFSKTYPAVYEYFSSFKQSLIARDIRNQGKYFWELRSCSYWNEFEKTKIIIPTITKGVQYALDCEGHFSNDKTSICITKNPSYVLGILNSKILWFLVQKVFPSRQNGFYEFKPTYVSQLPIPTTSKPDRLAIEALVQKCLDAKGVGVEQWEMEIDDRVAHLYRLTDEELKVIRGE